ncbi:MAG: metal ABC transporter ATP-binding protein [Acidimicrobiales bacterium]
MSDPAPGPLVTAGPAPAVDSAVDLDGVSVRRGGHVVWSRGTFAIPAGSMTAVIGPNGSGKTTLLEVLLGLLPTAGGTVRIFGRSDRRSGDVAYVPQDYTATAGAAMRARDAVQLGLTGTRWGLGRVPSDARPRTEEALRAVEADDIIDHRLSALSGGQRQRVAIAQALVSRPRLLLLDEPLANLDLRNQREVVSLLGRLNTDLGITIIIVTHDLNALLPVIDGAVYLIDGHAHYSPVDDVINDSLLSRLFATPLHVFRADDGDRFVRGA